MPYTYMITTTIPASAQEIYDAWLDSLAHSEMTGGKATMSEEIGAEISAWDGYITGRNLELLPSERIVQSWRTPEFSDQHEDSVITLTLEEIDGGTLLTLVHSNVPEEHTGYEQGSWQEYYFQPMKEYFANRERISATGTSKEAAPKTKRKRAATIGKSKRAAPRAKPRGEQKSKRTIAAKAKPKRTKKSELKPGRRKQT